MTDYQDQLITILLKIRLAFSMQTLSEADTEDLLIRQSLVWEEILINKIPINDLNNCYIKAMRTRTTTFPLTPQELIMAYNEITAENYKPQIYECVFCKFEIKTKGEKPCQFHKRVKDTL